MPTGTVVLFMLKYQSRRSNLNQTKPLKIPSWNLVKGLRQRGHFLSSDSMSFKAHCLHTAECPQGSRTLVRSPRRLKTLLQIKPLQVLGKSLGSYSCIHIYLRTYIRTEIHGLRYICIYVRSMSVHPPICLYVCTYLRMWYTHTARTSCLSTESTCLKWLSLHALKTLWYAKGQSSRERSCKPGQGIQRHHMFKDRIQCNCTGQTFYFLTTSLSTWN